MGRLEAWGPSLIIVQWTPVGLVITLGDRDMNIHMDVRLCTRAVTLCALR